MEKIQDKGLCSQGASSFQAQGAMGECAILGKLQMEGVMGGSSSTWGNPGRLHGRGVICKHKGSKGSAQKEVREGEGLLSTRSAGGLAAQQKERAGQCPLGPGSLLQRQAPSLPRVLLPPPPNISTQLLSWERVAGQGRRTWAHQPYSIQGSVYGQINSFGTCDDLIGAAVIFSFTLTCWFISKSFQ